MKATIRAILPPGGVIPTLGPHKFKNTSECFYMVVMDIDDHNEALTLYEKDAYKACVIATAIVSTLAGKSERP